MDVGERPATSFDEVAAAPPSAPAPDAPDAPAPDAPDAPASASAPASPADPAVPSASAGPSDPTSTAKPAVAAAKAAGNAKARKHVPFSVKFGICLAVMVVAMFGSFMMGRYQNVDAIMAAKITAKSVFPFLPIEGDWTTLDAKVVTEVRWPRILMALLVGAALSCAGASYQGVFRNPLVSPDILGISAAAGFGAAVGIIWQDAYSPWVQVLAFTFGICGVLMAYFLARTRGQIPNVMLILAGVVVSAIANAGISIMKYMADPYDDLPAITYWLMGSLSGMRWQNLAFAGPIILIALAVLFVFSWRLNLLTMGDDEAKSMGVKSSRLKSVVIVCATAMTATAVSQAGTIGWIGLVIPHMARMLVGPDHSKLIPTAAVIGGTFLLLIDDIVRTASETALPLSIPIALIGAPFFAVLIKKTKQGWTE